MTISKEVERALLFVLWHHQGGSSEVGQPIRKMLGIGEYDDMTPEQVRKASELYGLFAIAAKHP